MFVFINFIFFFYSILLFFPLNLLTSEVWVTGFVPVPVPWPLRWYPCTDQFEGWAGCEQSSAADSEFCGCVCRFEVLVLLIMCLNREPRLELQCCCAQLCALMASQALFSPLNCNRYFRGTKHVIKFGVWWRGEFHPVREEKLKVIPINNGNSY